MQCPHLFRNLGKGLKEGKFDGSHHFHGKRASSSRGSDRRGLMPTSINDGRLDLLLSTNGGPVYLFRNEAQNQCLNQSPVIRLKSEAQIGTVMASGLPYGLTAGGETTAQMLRSGLSYLSSSELPDARVGSTRTSRHIEIRWPKRPSGSPFQCAKRKGTITVNRRQRRSPPPSYAHKPNLGRRSAACWRHAAALRRTTGSNVSRSFGRSFPR